MPLRDRGDLFHQPTGFSLRGARITDLKEIESRFQDHLRGTQAEIWDIPISGDVLSTPFEREAREKQHSLLKTSV
jgi:hypothetical protein